jgi:hypothetical protein
MGEESDTMCNTGQLQSLTTADRVVLQMTTIRNTIALSTDAMSARLASKFVKAQSQSKIPACRADIISRSIVTQ